MLSSFLPEKNVLVWCSCTFQPQYHTTHFRAELHPYFHLILCAISRISFLKILLILLYSKFSFYLLVAQVLILAIYLQVLCPFSHSTNNSLRFLSSLPLGNFWSHKVKATWFMVYARLILMPCHRNKDLASSFWCVVNMQAMPEFTLHEIGHTILD